MKKFLKSFSVVGGIVSGLVLGIFFTTTGMAQESSQENVLIQKIESLVDSLNKLSSAASNDENTNELGFQNYFADVANPWCTDGYLSWPSSRFKKEDRPWNIEFMVGIHHQYNKSTQMIDLNGDGLIDYFYRANASSYPKLTDTYDGYNNQIPFREGHEECVYLNNGNGWDPVYRCVANTVYDQSASKYNITYYGDCADI